MTTKAHLLNDIESMKVRPTLRHDIVLAARAELSSNGLSNDFYTNVCNRLNVFHNDVATSVIANLNYTPVGNGTEIAVN